AANSHRLQNLLGDENFFRAISIRSRGQRDANRVSDAFLHQDCKTCRRTDNAFRTHAGFGQSEMQRVLAARSQNAIDIDEVLNSADFCADDDLIGTEAVLFCELGGAQCAQHHGFHHYVASFQRLRTLCVLVHHVCEKSLVERSPVHADANRLLVLDGALDHGAEVVVVFASDGNVSGIDPVLCQGLGAGRVLLEKDVAVVVEVADDGYLDSHHAEFFDHRVDRFSGVVVIDGDADELGTGEGEVGNLPDGRADVGGISVGHGLHHDWCISAHPNPTDIGGIRFTALNFCHTEYLQFNKSAAPRGVCD